MSQDIHSTPSRASSVFLITLAAFALFAAAAAFLQGMFGGKPDDAGAPDRIKKHDDVVAEQSALLQKYGLSADKADATIVKAAELIKIRAIGPSGVVVPGSPTAVKLAPAPATPAPAPAPAIPAPAAANAPAPAAVK